MSRNEKMDAGFYGVENVKFAERTAAKAYGTPMDVSYAKAISYAKDDVAKSEQRANNALLFAIPSSQQTASGTLSCTGRALNVEKVLGSYAEPASGAAADYAINEYVHGAIGYETVVLDASGKPTHIRVWVYNVEVDPKYTETLRGDETNPTLGSIDYAYKAYGETAEAADSTADYTDASGNKYTLFRKICRAGDDDYDTFLATVPDCKYVTAA